GRRERAGHLRPDAAQRVSEGRGAARGPGLMSIQSRAGTAITPAVPASPPEPLAAVSINEVSKAFGHGSNAVVALDRLRLDVRAGEFVCVIGASGCGKSTLLNLVAGLDQPTAGTVAVSGRAALMFQDAALFPWLTVTGNIELALRLRP